MQLMDPFGSYNSHLLHIFFIHSGCCCIGKETSNRGQSSTSITYHNVDTNTAESDRGGNED